jgi:hypothetical protein
MGPPRKSVLGFPFPVLWKTSGLLNSDQCLFQAKIYEINLMLFAEAFGVLL